MPTSVKIFKRLKKTISGQRTREKSSGPGGEPNNANPSVLDYSTVKELKDALMGKNRKHRKLKKKLSRAGAAAATSRSGKDSPTSTTEACDDEEEDYSFSPRAVEEPEGGGVEDAWKLSNLDMTTSEPQTMQQEVERLTALQSYFILDASTNREFDQITDMAARVFDVPVACITMIDLGRLWFLTATGIPNANGIEAPRKVAICAHVIKTRLNCLVVPDASKDERFKDSPLVSDPNGPSIRFYAGCPLIVPSGAQGGGAKLGTFCIIDQKPRTTEFTARDQQILRDMAALAVNALVSRRNRLLKQEQDSKMLELAESYAEMHSCLCKASNCVAGAVAAAASAARSRSGNSTLGGGSTRASRRASGGGVSLAGVSEVSETSNNRMDGSSEVSSDGFNDDDDGSIASYEQLADELKLHTDLSAANARTIVLDNQETAAFQFDNMEAVMEHDGMESFVDPKEQEELEKAKKKMIPPAYVRLLQATNGGTMDASDNYSVASRSLRAGGGSVGGSSRRDGGGNNKRMPKKTISNSSTTSGGGGGGGGGGGANTSNGVVNVLDLYQHLNDICMRFIDRPVPITVELMGKVPAQVICRGSDLLVFQATMSLLANANARVHRTAGSNDDDGGMIHLTVTTIHDGSTLLVECQDTGCFAAEWEGCMEFQNPRSLLYPVRRISRSLGGDCGMRLGCFVEERGRVDEKTVGMRVSAAAAGLHLLDDVEHEQQYCIFWWSMPLLVMENNHNNSNNNLVARAAANNTNDEKKLDDSIEGSVGGTYDDDDEEEEKDDDEEEEDHRENMLKTHEATSSSGCQ